MLIALSRVTLFLCFFTTFGAKAGEPYRGDLFDSHLHLDSSGFARRAAGCLEKNNVAKAILFAFSNPEDVAETDEELADELRGIESRFVPFFHVDPKSPRDMDVSRLLKVLTSSKNKFRGIGELGLYRAPWKGLRLTQYPFPGLLQLAMERGLAVMIHPRHDQIKELADVTEQFPRTTFLIHGLAQFQDFESVFKQRQNIIVTLDASELLHLDGESLLYNTRGGKEYFLIQLEKSYERLKGKASAMLKTYMALDSKRVVWGTDFSMNWHVDRDVCNKVISFSRQIIGELPDIKWQEALASTNARLRFESSFQQQEDL